MTTGPNKAAVAAISLAMKLRVQADGLEALVAATGLQTAKTTKRTPRLTSVLGKLKGHANKLRGLALELECSIAEVGDDASPAESRAIDYMAKMLRGER